MSAIFQKKNQFLQNLLPPPSPSIQKYLEYVVWQLKNSSFMNQYSEKRAQTYVLGQRQKKENKDVEARGAHLPTGGK